MVTVQPFLLFIINLIILFPCLPERKSRLKESMEWGPSLIFTVLNELPRRSKRTLLQSNRKVGSHERFLYYQCYYY